MCSSFGNRTRTPYSWLQTMNIEHSSNHHYVCNFHQLYHSSIKIVMALKNLLRNILQKLKFIKSIKYCAILFPYLISVTVIELFHNNVFDKRRGEKVTVWTISSIILEERSQFEKGEEINFFETGNIQGDPCMIWRTKWYSSYF